MTSIAFLFIIFSSFKINVGLKSEWRAKNYSIIRPKKDFLGLSIKIPETEENDSLINSAELITYEYDRRWGAYRLKIKEKDLKEKEETIKKLILYAKETFG